jgi:hypothetical protein
MIPHFSTTQVKPIIINIKQWSKQYNFIIDTIQKNNNLSIAIISRKNWRLYEVDTYLNLYGIKSKLLDSDEDKVKENNEGVTICTIHKSKGLEWDMVFIIGLSDKHFPCSDSKIEEERRLFYVAITRAKQKLYMIVDNEPTRFLKELHENDVEMMGITYREILASIDNEYRVNRTNSFNLDSCPIDKFYRVKKLLLQAKIETITLWDKIEIPSFIIVNNLTREFHSFITLCIKRMKTSKLKLDEFTKKLIYSIRVDYKTKKNINENELNFNLKNLHEKVNYSHQKLTQLEEKIYTTSHICNVKPEEIQICVENEIKLYSIYIPYIHNSFFDFINENNLWYNILSQIYIVNLIKSIKCNRIKSLFTNLDCLWIKEIESFLFDIEKLLENTGVSSITPIFEDYFIDDNNKLWIIKNSEIKLEWLIDIVLLGYDEATILDPIAGNLYKISCLPRIDLLNEIQTN